ncbi:MAG: hypothetical protein CVU46_09745 [Chloroflexi bacterium HGW-Chloroflexi-8]|nr:MAG: hypothetical protein CVU46_09745 [Chloroflexi bacterium HGW-Chloroflexi-8]
MNYFIRPEAQKDYYRVAEINALAFRSFIENPAERSYIAEVTLVDSLRHSANFDPDLALVAEWEGEVVGYALFTPYTVRIGGVEHKAVSLAPLTVDPKMQKMGVGTALMEKGHAIAKEKGYDFAFLLGHTEYYPRFGYQTGMFGPYVLDVKVTDIPAGELDLVEREVRRGDIPDLVDMWHTWFDDVDLALFPGSTLLDWISHCEKIISTVLVEDDKVLGYTRYMLGDAGDVKLFLARDEKAVLQVLRFLAEKAIKHDQAMLHLPLHSDSACVQNWIKIPFTVQKSIWNAAMICLLNEQNLVVKSYLDQVQSGLRTQGLLLYPPQVEFS